MPVKILDPLTAQRIAAGEVIERPSSVLRELLDNSIDARSTHIAVYVEEGGAGLISVIDDGKGINHEDFPLLCHRHATSKIGNLEDLFHLSTLGFRGEALYSIASCSKLSISSNGKKLVVDNGITKPITDSGVTNGTVINVYDLFATIPARKQFLKRNSTEERDCKKVFMEKASAFPNISFQFFSEGKLVVNYPACSGKQRVFDILNNDRNFVNSTAKEMKAVTDNCSVYAVAGSPSCYRSDRTQIKVFINNRAVDYYPLVQAVTYGYGESLPGGRFPFFYLFIKNNPELVDFNIHPTKRECRLRNSSEVHSLVTNMIKDQLTRVETRINITEDSKPFFVSETASWENKPSDFNPYTKKQPYQYDKEPKPDPDWFDRAKENLLNTKIQTEPETIRVSEDNFKYLGQAFKLFLIVEKDDQLMLIDQHAAHERVLFEEIKRNESFQHLMIPYSFEVSNDVDSFLQKNSFIYADYGIELTKKADLLWEINSIPAIAKESESKVAKFISSVLSIDEIEKNLFAVLSCKSAIKAGDTVDYLSAIELLRKVFKLDSFVCPHGRSFIIRIAKDDLVKGVGRFK